MENVTYCPAKNRRLEIRHTKQGSCRATRNIVNSWDVGRQSAGKWFLGKGSRQTSTFELIERFRYEDDPRQLGALVDQLIQLRGGHEIGLWLKDNLDAWLRQRHAALGAIIEAAVALSLSSSDARNVSLAPSTVQEAIVKILAFPKADRTVASIAAQRVRLLPFLDSGIRKRAWLSLESWLELWLRNPDDAELAELALPSAAIVGQSDATEWLVQTILQGAPVMSRAVLIGVINWAVEAGYAIEERPAQALSRAVLGRLEKEAGSDSIVSFELMADLVWALGAIATKAELPAASKVIARCFQTPQWVEDAAAISAGRILFQRFKSEAQRSLGDALGGRDSDTYMKFELAILPAVVNLNHHGVNGSNSGRIWDSSTR